MSGDGRAGQRIDDSRRVGPALLAVAGGGLLLTAAYFLRSGDELRAIQWFLAAIAVASIGAPLEAVRMWRGTSMQLLGPSSWWPYSEELWWAHVRAKFVGALTAGPALGLVALYVAVELHGWPAVPADLGGWYSVLRVAALGSFGVMMVSMLSVAVFAAPRWAVPPPVREHDGWITVLDGR